jgi:hypothetical protein
LVLTFIMAAEPAISFRRFRWVVLVHALAVTAGSIFIIYRVYALNIADPREASSLISHIRFALNVCLSAFFLLYFIFRDREIKWIVRIPLILLFLWQAVFLLLLESATGYAVFALLGVALLLRAIFMRTSKKTKLIASGVIVIAVTAVVFIAVKFFNENFRTEAIDTAKLEYYTPQGHPYVHNIENLQRENGYYLWLYVCDQELREGWNQRSTISFDSIDNSGQQLRYTLIRFLTSKGLRKDKGGIDSLSEEEVRAVERGIANVDELNKPGFLNRIEKVVWEMNDYFYVGDPKDHSFMQRVELWKASFSIIGRNPIIGVGTGDVPNAFAEELRRSDSPLQGQGMRTHDQYLAMAVAFGIPGMLYFLFALFFSPVQKKKMWGYFFFCFFLIGLVSMLTEDTLESQPGVSFFMFFYALLLYGAVTSPGLASAKDAEAKQ